MGRVADRIAGLGIVLPPPLVLPPGVVLPFPEVNIRGDRAFVSGCTALDEAGALMGPFGAVGAEVSVEEAHHLARHTGIAMLAALTRSLGDLDRIAGWARVFGMVCSAPGFVQQPAVINGFTEVIHEVFGPQIGQHARSAVGMVALPMDIAVEVEAELLIRV